MGWTIRSNGLFPISFEHRIHRINQIKMVTSDGNSNIVYSSMWTPNDTRRKYRFKFCFKITMQNQKNWKIERISNQLKIEIREYTSGRTIGSNEKQLNITSLLSTTLFISFPLSLSVCLSIGRYYYLLKFTICLLLSK